jgi:drug/metabolite transporter (DMT)-like permease
MKDTNIDTLSAMVAVILAVFVAAVSVYQVRVRREPFDGAAIRLIGLLLGLCLFALCIAMFDFRVTGDEDWIDWLLVGFGALFAWLVRPRE